MHTLFRTTPSILLPCLGQRTKWTPPCLIGICNWESSRYSEDMEYKQISPYKSTQFCRQYSFFILLAQSRRKFKKIFTTCRLFPVVHPLDTPCLGQRGQNPSPYRPYKEVPSPPSDQNVRLSGLYSELKTTQSRTQYLHWWDIFRASIIANTWIII